MKNISTYLVTIFALLFSVFIIIPDLNKNLTDYYKTEKYYKSSEILERKMLIRADKKSLIIKMSDGSEWIVGRAYSQYFSKINSNSNIGKKFTLYTSSETDNSPSRIEIENKLIYNFDNGRFYYYFILAATSVLIYFSIIGFKKRKKPAGNTV